ncbi:MAG: hypothetical protein LQ341_007541 [Variospora aurantia]|nr:MAG: hypothetical protein LQ341_007541 [Variospora aurantia]
MDYSSAAPNISHQGHHMRSGPGMHATPAKKNVAGAAVNSSPYPTTGWNDWIQPGEAGATSLNNRTIHPSVPAWPPSAEAAVLTPATTPCQDNAASARGDNAAKKLEDSASPAAVGAPLSGSISKDILDEVVRLALIRQKVSQPRTLALTAVIQEKLKKVDDLVGSSAVMANDDILLVLENLCEMNEDGSKYWTELFQLDQLIDTTVHRLLRENHVDEAILD